MPPGIREQLLKLYNRKKNIVHVKCSKEYHVSAVLFFGTVGLKRIIVIANEGACALETSIVILVLRKAYLMKII